jgi:hypothetical protein
MVTCTLLILDELEELLYLSQVYLLYIDVEYENSWHSHVHVHSHAVLRFGKSQERSY